MAEKNERKKSKVNDCMGEEGTDGSKQKRGGGKDHLQPHHKKTGIAGGAHFVYKRMTGQPRLSSAAKENEDKYFTRPPLSEGQQESPQQHKDSQGWDSWEKTPPSDARDTDPVQPIASVTVISSTEETESDDIQLHVSTEEATPTVIKYDDDDTNITTDADLSSFVVVPQQSSDDPELSLKLARIELENERHKRELKDKERQIKEYEEEIIVLRTKMSRSRGGGGRGRGRGGRGGVQAVVDQSTTQKLTRTVQLEKEKEELMKGKEELTKEKDELMKEKEGLEQKLTAENGDLKKKKEEILAKSEVMMEHHQKYEAQEKQYKKEMDKKMEQLLEVTAEEKKKDEAVLKEMEELKIQVKMRTQEIETLEKNLKAQLEEKSIAYIKLEEDFEKKVSKRVREAVDQHMRNERKPQVAAFGARIEGSEIQLKAQYEAREKQLQNELEELSKKLKQKEDDENNLRGELAILQEKVEAGDGASANNSLSEEDKMKKELETRVRELEDQIAKVEGDKRIQVKAQETLQNDLRVAEVQVEDKDKTIQNLTGDLEYYKALNKESEKLRDTLKHLEEEMTSTEKTVDELSGELSNKLQENEDLNDLLEEKEQEIVRLTTTAQLASKEKEQTLRQLREQLDEAVKEFNKQKLRLKELVENMQAKEAENAVYKQDFESERNDRQRIHAEYEELKTRTEEARKQNKIDKEAVANLGEVIKAQDEEIRILKIELNAHSRKNDWNQDEEIQILTAQVNAYCREVDKQKGLLIQSQEKHKTEVSELNQKLNEEIKFKQELASELAMMRQQLDKLSRTNQKLDNELARMRQQFTNILANNEQLLTAYHEERAMVTRLEDLNEKLKKANEVLVDKLKGNNTSTASSQAHISSRRNDVPGGNYYQISAQAGSGPGVKGEGDEMEHSNRAYSDLINEKPQFTSEEMAALFKKPAQPAQPEYYETESDYDEHEAEKEKIKIDKELEEIDQLRQKTPFLQELPKAADKDDDKGRALDPNLVCPKCRKQYREGQIQKLRRHINARCSNEDSDESDEEIDKDEEEIWRMAEKGRKEMQGPSTAEVLFNDNDDSSLPYDPNLVCPKCGKQYRVGEIQKLRRHINEFCTGIR